METFQAQQGRDPSSEDVDFTANETVLPLSDPAATSFILMEIVRMNKNLPPLQTLQSGDLLRSFFVAKILPLLADSVECKGEGTSVRLQVKCEALSQVKSALVSKPQEDTSAKISVSDEVDPESAKREVNFQRSVANLKREKRTGWVLRNVPDPESVSDHSFGVALGAFLVQDDSIDRSKAVMMGLLHDVAESIVGDIAPGQGISDTEKHSREHAAMEELLHNQLGGGAHANYIEALWKEYEARESPESLLVKDLDRWEMILTADGYERDAAPERQDFLQEFYEGVRGKIKHPRVQAWQKSLEASRNERLAQRNESH